MGGPGWAAGRGNKRGCRPFGGGKNRGIMYGGLEAAAQDATVEPWRKPVARTAFCASAVEEISHASSRPQDSTSATTQSEALRPLAPPRWRSVAGLQLATIDGVAVAIASAVAYVGRFGQLQGL